MKRKILSLFLVLALVVSAVPALALNANVGGLAESLGIEAFASESTRHITVDKTNAESAKLFTVEDTSFSNNLLGSGNTADVSDGDYVLCMYNVDNDCLGTIVVTVGEGSTDFTAYAVTVNCKNSGWTYETDYTVTASAVSGGSEASDFRSITMGKNGSKPSFLCLNGDAIDATVLPSEDKKSENFAKATGSNVVTGTTYAKADVTCTKACSLNVKYPYADDNNDGNNDYILEVGQLARYYVFSYFEPDSVTEPVEGSVTANFNGLSSNTTYYYRVTNSISRDAVTYGKYTAKLSEGTTNVDVKASDMYVGKPKNKNTTVENFSLNSYDVADIYLSVGGDVEGNITGYNGAAGWLNMPVGKDLTLYPYRNWLPINTMTSNVPMQPDFHVQVLNLEGNPVNITENTANNALKHSWNISATSDGTAIILITYDALAYGDAADSGKKEGDNLFSAIWPKNTGVIVVTVGKDGGINTNMTINESRNKNASDPTKSPKLVEDAYDAELDVLYYVGEEGASYSFKPEGGTDVTMAVCAYDATGAMTFGSFTKNGVSVGADGTVTLSGLKEGKTIVKLTNGDKVAYQILRAEHTDVVIMNSAGKVYMDTAVGYKDDTMTFAPGENVSITYSDLYHPANKLSGIYNMSAAVYLTKMDGELLVKGKANQHNFASRPETHTVSFTIPNDAVDDFSFGGCLNASGFGSRYGYHRLPKYEIGKTPNFTAGSYNGYMGRLPQFSLPIDANATPPAVVNATFSIKSTAVAKSQKLFALNDTTMSNDLLGGRTSSVPIAEGNYILALYDANNALLGTTDITINSSSKTFNTFVVTVNVNDGWNCGTDYRVTASVSKDDITRNITIGESGQSFICLSGDTVKATVIPSKGKKQLGFETTTSAEKVVSKAADATVDVTCTTREVTAPSSPSTSENITVTFRLIGCEEAKEDVDLGKSDYIPNYVTWVSTTSYELPKDSTAYDLWTIATKDASIKSEGADNNYISSVWAPEKFGGYELSEFANGARSGWMYTINGSHPGYGVKEQELKNNDKVIFHYVNDYSYEVDDWFDDPLYPSLGDGTYYNGWLKAADRVGAAGGLGGGGGEIAQTAPTGNIKVEAEVKNGEAKAAVSAFKVDEAITSMKKDNAKTLVIEPTVKGDAKKVSVDLPKTAAGKIVSDTDATLNIKTSIGEIVIPNDALSEIVKQAGGSDISMTMETVDAKESAKQIMADESLGETKIDTEKAVAVEFKIVSGNNVISSFGGKTLHVTVPVDKAKFTTGKTYVAFVVHDDKTIEKTTAKITNGNADVAMTRFSTVLITEDEAVQIANPFTDVHESDYFYNPVMWALEKNVTGGVSADSFAPFDGCTRAQMVTFLWRAAGKPWASANHHFSDVASDAYYAEAVEWAIVSGITKGIGETTFAPNDTVTREQLASFIYRYAKDNGRGYETAPTTKLDFNDAGSVHAWADEAMHWCVEKNIVSGMGEKMLAPQNEANRAQIVTMLYRYFNM